MDIIIILVTRLPIMYIKALFWVWVWRKLFKKDKLEFMEAVIASLSPIVVCILNIIFHIHIGKPLNIFYTITANGIIAIAIYFLSQREKRVDINVAGRLNTPEYKRYSEVLGIPSGKIDKDKLIQSYMAARRNAKDAAEKELVETAYLYFTNYKEYKETMKQQEKQLVQDTKPKEEAETLPH